MGDIAQKQDVVLFVNSFYQKIRADHLIGPIFSGKVADDQWPQHLARMASFWNTVLFGVMDYRGNPFSHHRDLNINSKHFDRWISLFNKTIQDNFQGPKADEAMLRAHKMRLMFEAKLAYANNPSNGYNIL